MATIADVVANLQDVGVFKFFLPFILMFAIFYGLLTKTKIFGDPKDDPGVTKINAIVSFVAAMFIMIFPTTNSLVYQGMDFAIDTFLGQFVGGALIFFVIIIVFLMILFMIATPLSKDHKTPEIASIAPIAAVVGVVMVIALFLSSGGSQLFPGVSLGPSYAFPSFSFGATSIDPSVIAIIIVFLVMALAIYWVTKK
jgi:hypothetical protein